MATRKEILEMLSAGEIDVTRATELLNAVGPSPAESADPAPPAPPAAPATLAASEAPAVSTSGKTGRRWLHVHVSDLASGQSRVRVNVPLGLVNFGLKVGARFTDELTDGLVDDVMEILEDDELTGTLVEVEDVEDNERVHIYID
jgi:hypothetical protein